MMRVARWVLPLGMVQFLKAAAEAETALVEIRECATRIAPDDLRRIDDRLFAAKAEADNGFFAKAKLECETVRDDVRELGACLAERQADLEARWTSLAAALAEALSSLHARFVRLKRGPSGMTSRWFDSVRVKYLEVQAAWGRAQSAARGGRWAEAVSKGEEAKKSACDLVDELRGF